MHDLLSDIRFALRLFARNRLVTFVAVVAIGLAIGVNTTIFSAIDSALLQPLPFKSPSRLSMIWATRPKQGMNQVQVSVRDFFEIKRQDSLFQKMAALEDHQFIQTGISSPRRVYGTLVSPELFDLLGARAYLGRTFFLDEGEPGRDNVTVLSYFLWQRVFAGDPNIVGKTVLLDQKKFTVIGVMTQAFGIPGWSDQTLWVPHDFAGLSIGSDRTNRILYVIARLKSGAKVSQARTEMNTIALRLERAYPEADRDYGLRLESLRFWNIADPYTVLLLFLGAVLFVLLIACSNVANLQLSGAASRRHEMAIRMALGCRPSRLARQLITENVSLAVLGGGFGLLLSFAGVRAMRVLGADIVPYAENIRINSSILLFVVAVSLLSGVFFGVLPAFDAVRTNPGEVIKGGGSRSIGNSAGTRMQNVFVVSQIALALALLAAASLMTRTVLKINEFNPGFNPLNVVTATLEVPQFIHSTASQMFVPYRSVLEQLKSTSGVQSAAFTSSLPLWGFDTRFFNKDGGQSVPDSSAPIAQYQVVSANYLRVMEIPLLAGRDFTEGDSSSAPAVAIVNKAMADRWWPNQNPIGQTLSVLGAPDALSGGSPSGSQRGVFRVIGIVGDVKGWSSNDERPSDTIYVPYGQHFQRSMFLVWRTNVRAARQEAIVAELRSKNSECLIGDPRSMKEILRYEIETPRFTAALLSAFSILALILAAVGIYGVISYSVKLQTRAIGIRMALGAQREDILRLIVGKGMFLTLVGVGCGLVIAFAVTRLLSSLLYGVRPFDALSLVFVSLLLILVALLATAVPAFRAMRLEPVEALRHE